MDWKVLLLSADGRIKRQAYWMGWLVVFAVSIVCSLVLGALSRYASYVLVLILIYPNVCIYSKRLHDLGQSGWLAAIPFGLSIATSLVSLYTLATTGIAAGIMPRDPTAAMALLGHMGPALALGSVSGLVSLVFWLWLGIAEGQHGSNRYGPEPGAGNEEVL